MSSSRLRKSLVSRLRRPFSQGAASGMTLIEIIFAVSLILIMTIATSSVIRSGIDLRIELSQRAKVNHRLMIIMQRITDDLQQAFILDSQRAELNYVDRNTKSVFSIGLNSGNSELRLTTMSHQAINANSFESDQTFVVYRIEKDKESSRPYLMRGDAQMIPTNLDEDPAMQILARNIKSLKINAWNGDSWKEEWNSNKSDWRNTMPRLVQIEIEAYSNDPDADNKSSFEEGDATAVLRTEVYLPRAIQYKEPRDPPKSATYK